MRPIVALSFIALLTGWGMQQPNVRFDGAWALGLLMLAAYLGGLVAQQLRMPPLLGWLLAGLLAGSSGAAAVEGGSGSYLYPFYILVALWFGCQVGLISGWRRVLVQPRLLALLGLSTLLVGLVVMLVCVFLVGLSWSLALVVGALSGLWGGFALSAMDEGGIKVGLGLVGNGLALVVLTAVLGGLAWRQELDASVMVPVGQVWLSLCGGVAVGEVFGWLRSLNRAPPVVLSLLAVGGFCALMVYHFGLYPLVFGVAAGMALARRSQQREELVGHLRPIRLLIGMVFFALMGARLDLHLLLAPQQGLYSVLLAQLVALLVLRVVGPMLWPLLVDGNQNDKKSGLFLLVNGVLLFELAGQSPGGLLDFGEKSWGVLLRQVVLADIILYLSVFVLLATILQKPLGRFLKAAGAEKAS